MFCILHITSFSFLSCCQSHIATDDDWLLVTKIALSHYFSLPYDRQDHITQQKIIDYEQENIDLVYCLFSKVVSLVYEL